MAKKRQYPKKIFKSASSGRATEGSPAGFDTDSVREVGERKAGVMLVDACPVTRLGLRIVLASCRDVAVVGEAAGSEEALRLAREHQPELVILDTQLNEASGGLDLCKRLKTLFSGRTPRALIYTAQNSREDVAAASLSGADGYVHKEADCETLRDAVGKVCRGERLWYLGPEKAPAHSRLREQIEEAHLTPKEQEIASLLLERHSTAEIAENLCLSRNTVKTHVSSVFRKLGIRSRQELFKGGPF